MLNAVVDFTAYTFIWLALGLFWFGLAAGAIALVKAILNK